MADKYISENDSGLNKEFENIELRSQKDILKKFNILKMRLREFSIIIEMYPEDNEEIMQLIKKIEELLIELKDDANIIYPRILSEMYIFEIQLKMTKKEIKIS